MLDGCSSLGGASRRQSIATVIQTAYDLGGREMHLRRDASVAKRSGWLRPKAELRSSRKGPRRQVPRRAERGALRSKVARGCAVSNKIESLVAEGKLSPSQEFPPSEASAAGGSMRGVRLHALAQLAYEGIMDDLAAGGGAATNAELYLSFRTCRLDRFASVASPHCLHTFCSPFLLALKS